MNERGCAHLKGHFFQVRLDYVRETHGQDALERLLASLPECERLPLEALDANGWYPFRSLNALDRRIASTLAPGDPGLFERFGALSARHRADVLGAHARLVNVHAFLSRLAEEHPQHHDFGRMTYRRLGFHEGEVRTFGFHETDEVYCLGARGFLRAAVERLTGAEAEVREGMCQCRRQPFCLFRLSWAPTGSDNA